MTLTSEDLLAISQLLDAKLDSRIRPLETRLKNMELLLENNVLPRLQNIESCYTSTYQRYSSGIQRLEELQSVSATSFFISTTSLQRSLYTPPRKSHWRW